MVDIQRFLGLALGYCTDAFLASPHFCYMPTQSQRVTGLFHKPHYSLHVPVLWYLYFFMAIQDQDISRSTHELYRKPNMRHLVWNIACIPEADTWGTFVTQYHLFSLGLYWRKNICVDSSYRGTFCSQNSQVTACTFTLTTYISAIHCSGRLVVNIFHRPLCTDTSGTFPEDVLQGFISREHHVLQIEWSYMGMCQMMWGCN